MPQHDGPDLIEDRDLAKYDYISFMERMMEDADDEESESLNGGNWSLLLISTKQNIPFGANIGVRWIVYLLYWDGGNFCWDGIPITRHTLLWFLMTFSCHCHILTSLFVLLLSFLLIADEFPFHRMSTLLFVHVYVLWDIPYGLCMGWRVDELRPSWC